MKKETDINMMDAMVFMMTIEMVEECRYLAEDIGDAILGSNLSKPLEKEIIEIAGKYVASVDLFASSVNILNGLTSEDRNDIYNAMLKYAEGVIGMFNGKD